MGTYSSAKQLAGRQTMKRRVSLKLFLLKIRIDSHA